MCRISTASVLPRRPRRRGAASISSSSIFFDKLAAPGRGDSFLHGGKETGFFVEIPGNNVRHQPLGDGPGFGGDPRKLGLLLGGEMYFHSLKIPESLGSGKLRKGPFV
jgi:hypothetical protein